MNLKTQSGRSMVEMLGTLAIIGVLSIGGIAGYSYGMDKYRANTIINDVMLRHVDIIAQNMRGGTPNLSEWPTMTVGKYTIGLEEGTTGIQISDLPESICEIVFDGMINNATVKIGTTEYDSATDDDVCGDTNTMVFYVDEGSIRGGDTQEGEEEPDLCATVTCRECTACNANTGRCEAANENLTCGKNRDGVCESGVCLTDGTPDMTSWEECSSDNECGDMGCATCDGYCNLYRQDERTCIKDGISGVCRYGICYTENCPQEGCPTGQYCADTNESCDVAHPSVCANMIDLVRKKINVNGIEETWYISKYRTSWWEAQAVCAGLGKTMPSVSDLMDGNGKRSIALSKVLGQEMYLWTSDLKDSCYAYYVRITSNGGWVSERERHYGGGMNHSYAACK